MKFPKIEINKDTGIKVAKVAGGLVLGLACAAFGAIVGKKTEKTEETEETEKTEEIEETEETTVDEAEVEETNDETENTEEDAAE